MASSDHTLHILLFPFMAQGHILPAVDMAKLFAARGVKATILTTPANASLIQPSLDRAKNSGHPPIHLHLIPFPSVEAGLPEGCENVSSLTSPSLVDNFFNCLPLLRQPFDRVLRDLHPDCVITDMFFPWTYDVAAEHNIPRLVFHGMSFFSQCAEHSIYQHKPHKSLPPDVESFVIPGLPHRIEMHKSHVLGMEQGSPTMVDIINQMRESESKSYGVVMNSFYELEPEYVQHYREAVGRKAWHIGPLSLCNRDIADTSRRGSKASIDRNACLKWLDNKSPRSVIYVCFGSLGEFPKAQLREMALGLEASNHPFIMVVRRGGEDCMPEGFEERVEGRGLIIKGWAPQILILNHHAVGGFLTHCGWNSSLEGVSAGIPLITWPMFADQFYNERLIVDVLKIGVAVGVEKIGVHEDESTMVEAAKVKRAVECLMDSGEEAEARRRRARELGEMAHKAVEEGGSSYIDVGNLIAELVERKTSSCMSNSKPESVKLNAYPNPHPIRAEGSSEADSYPTRNQVGIC